MQKLRPTSARTLMTLLLALVLAAAVPAQVPLRPPAVAAELDRVGEEYVRSPREAWERLERVRERARTAGDPTLWADWHLLAGLVHMARDDVAAGEALVERGYGLYRSLGDDEGLLWATLIRGEIRAEAGRYPEAIEDFEAVLAGADALEEAEVYRAEAWLGLGNAHAVTGDFAAALAALTRAFEAYRALGDELALASVYGLLGNVYSDIDAPEEALAMYREATAVDRRLGDDLNLAINLYNTARAYIDLGRTDEARALLGEAELLAERAGSPITGGYVAFGRGLALAADGDDPAARRAFEDARAVFESVGDRFQQALTGHQLARLSLRAGDAVAALAEAGAAQAILEAAEDRKHLVEVLAVLAGGHAAQGDHATAYELSRRRARLMEEHASAERARRVAHLRVNLDFDRAEEAARSADAAASRKDRELARERFHGRIILAAAALLLAALVLLGMSFLRQKRLEARLRHLADTDDLTGLLSRRRLFALGERELARALRHGSPLSALLLDLDLFKGVNDRYGHATGDDVLARVTGCITAVLRETDCIGRIGGEEFLALLPDTPPERAQEVAARLVGAVARLDLRPTGVEERLTMSVGITACQGAGDTLAQMIRRADAALYEAKRRGRNRAWADWELAG